MTDNLYHTSSWEGVRFFLDASSDLNREFTNLTVCFFKAVDDGKDIDAEKILKNLQRICKDSFTFMADDQLDQKGEAAYKLIQGVEIGIRYSQPENNLKEKAFTYA